MRSALTHLECSKCKAHVDADRLQQTCTCGGPLLARYDLNRAAATLTRAKLAGRERSLWRYGELLPLRESANRIDMREGMTPIVALEKTGRELGLRKLYLKDEGTLPTGTFKARGAAVGLSRARELGVHRFGIPTNGNAGAAWAAYAARAGIEAYVVMPRDAPSNHQLECAMAGARVWLVDGRIGEAAAIVSRAREEHGLYDASTLREPYRIEGKKTAAFEFTEQLDWDVPDVVIFPTGGGVGVIGAHKALGELQAVGLIGEKLPRFVAVQAEGCAPIVRAHREGRRESSPWVDAATIAFGINVPKAAGDFLVLETISRTGGTAVAVTDSAILAMQRVLGSREGIFVCAEGAAALAAAKLLRDQNWIDPDERVLLFNTGTGLKCSGVPYRAPSVLERGAALPIAS